MFAKELPYKTQSVVGWDLKPDILIHGSPCQDFSIAGLQRGADIGTETRSSLMWETLKIINQMGVWKPRIVIWENVKNVLSKHMIHNFNGYLREMEKLGYANSFEVLDAREFGLPQARERVFTISCLDGTHFDFTDLIRTPMRDIAEFKDEVVPIRYLVNQPSILNCIGGKGIRRTTIIQNCAYTITERPDRCPAQVFDIGDGLYRFLTERESWKLQGYSDEDFENAASVSTSRALYKQAGNSIPVTIFESIFRKILLGETQEVEHKQISVFEEVKK